MKALLQRVSSARVEVGGEHRGVDLERRVCLGDPPWQAHHQRHVARAMQKGGLAKDAVIAQVLGGEREEDQED